MSNWKGTAEGQIDITPKNVNIKSNEGLRSCECDL